MLVAYGVVFRDRSDGDAIDPVGVVAVVVNAAAVERRSEVARIADRLGSSTLVVSIDAAMVGGWHL